MPDQELDKSEGDGSLEIDLLDSPSLNDVEIEGDMLSAIDPGPLDLDDTLTNDPPRDDPPTHSQDPILGVGEVARQLGKSPNTIRSWIKDGLLRAIKMPSTLYGIRKSEVNKFLGGSALNKQVK